MSNSGINEFSDPRQPFEMSNSVQFSFMIIEDNYFVSKM